MIKKILYASIMAAGLSAAFSTSILATDNMLPSLILAPPVLEAGNDEDAVLFVPEQENGASYITFEGAIEEVAEVEGCYMVTTTGTDDTVVFRIFEETPVFLRSTMSSVSHSGLKTGQKITVAYSSNTPVSMSLPPQINPEVVIINDDDDLGKVKVDVFDKDGLSSDKQLRLNVSDKTAIVSLNGSPSSKEDIKGSVSVVFYSIETRSIPPQTSPEKIIILKKGAADILEVDEDFESTMQAQADLVLQLFSGEQIMERESVKYVKLADIASYLGYEVVWQGETMTITLQKGLGLFSLQIGELQYTHNFALGNFENAPFIHNDRTFIEDRFVVNLIINKVISEKVGSSH